MRLDRREFLHRLSGTLLAAGVSTDKACRRRDGPPAPCPIRRPASRVLTTKYQYPVVSEPILWATTRELNPRGGWSAMASANFLPGNGNFSIWDVDEIAVPRGSRYGCTESHVVIVGTPINNDDWELLYQRQRADGTWTSIHNLSYGIGGTVTPGRPRFTFESVSVARVGTELHVCGATSSRSRIVRPGLLMHGIRPTDVNVDDGYELRAWREPWSNATDLAGGISGQIVDVGCAGVANPNTGRDDLHVCAVTHDGRLWHAIHNGTAWTPFGDVGAQAGSNGPFKRVDVASLPNRLYVVAITQMGQILYTIRGTNSWRPFQDVVAAAAAENGLPAPDFRAHNVSVAFCNGGLPDREWQLYVVVSNQMNGPRLVYTIHSSQAMAWPQLPQGRSSTWMPWVDLLEEAGGGGEGGEFGNEYSSFSVAQCEVG